MQTSVQKPTQHNKSMLLRSGLSRNAIILDLLIVARWKL
jgi:hypothetical protein